MEISTLDKLWAGLQAGPDHVLKSKRKYYFVEVKHIYQVNIFKPVELIQKHMPFKNLTNSK